MSIEKMEVLLLQAEESAMCLEVSGCYVKNFTHPSESRIIVRISEIAEDTKETELRDSLLPPISCKGEYRSHNSIFRVLFWSRLLVLR